ncbi:hypothetical protein XI00_38275 [Bradyrhizobium sp. CCBAU 21359]|uniref:CoA transferase n=1 Tax=Bradyrhizobium sp. CCBAU 21359 TaxID=1325080 RepID=UPI00230673CC|nr:CoA transferase [Bradyrhizobium sp. CCBAU 21359]MDA9460017.1 hypothetical protein [Bradyrhizobium sp. CCBAU 21359]
METSIRALSHLRVVEISSFDGVSYCTRLFADFGADVQKIELAGAPLRRSAPLTPDGQSAWFAFLNFNKSSITNDANDGAPQGRELSLREGLTRIIVDWSGSWQAARSGN